ncbi:MAG TPA: NAD-dependent malic enzyme [Blastocatellia bacterium]|jgi:malate dehydrogenase (oxaloacetate-decarboxylating)
MNKAQSKIVPFKRVYESGEEVIETALSGQLLLDYAPLNKGSAFSDQERREFDLLGLLPPHVSSVEDQLLRNYENYRKTTTDLERYVFLTSLQDRNETLFFMLLGRHITEMLPVIYTPVVGVASQTYSHIYRSPRGLYISYPHRDEMETILDNAPRSGVEVIVVTDGERILGLGDLGVGGMGIPIGKLSLYTICAGVHPATTLPVFLDVGTNNADLLSDRLYLGWRSKRVGGAQYDEFIERFVEGVRRRFPDVLLQWEDFSRNNARRLLDLYRDRLCTFNDDIQGTGAVTLAGLLAAVKVTASPMSDQRIVILGAGSAATGVADQIVAAMTGEGLTKQEARLRLWLVDIGGLLHTLRTDLEPFNEIYAQPFERVAGWEGARGGKITFEEVVRRARPTIMIGASAQRGAFTESIVREMAAHVDRPIIFPLSNPTSLSEADPADLIEWTDGRALVATGSPFPDVVHDGRTYRIGQCNNVYIFPGVGLGVIASGASRVTDEMFVAAARALAEMSPALSEPAASLFPPVKDVRKASRSVALAVASEALGAGVTRALKDDDLVSRIDAKMWTPGYARYRRVRSII